LTLSAVFPPALAADDRFAVAITGAYLSLSRDGAVQAAAQVADGQD
jgi:fructuronate reductase